MYVCIYKSVYMNIYGGYSMFELVAAGLTIDSTAYRYIYVYNYIRTYMHSYIHTNICMQICIKNNAIYVYIYISIHRYEYMNITIQTYVLHRDKAASDQRNSQYNRFRGRLIYVHT
jgi:hypothetical protein